jgi:hypothetical protein
LTNACARPRAFTIRRPVRLSTLEKALSMAVCASGDAALTAPAEAAE